MSHDISFNVNGSAEAVFNNTPAWHGLGEVIETGAGNRLTSDRILEVCPSIGFKTDKRPAYFPLFNADGSPQLDDNGSQRFQECNGKYITVRTDAQRDLGAVGERYKVYQNTEAFAFLDSLVSDGLLEYESAMALQGGAKIALLARLPEIDSILPGDDLKRYLLLSTSHDGSSSVEILPTTVRVVCANTLRLAMQGKGNAAYRCTVRHTASMSHNLELARDFIMESEQAFAQFADAARTLANVACSTEQMNAFVNELYPAPTDELGSLQDSRKGTIYRNKMDEIARAIQHPSNQVQGMRGTWWQALNAVTYVVDHKSRTRGGNARERSENRFLNVIDGPGADLKQRALQLAMQMSA